jgi:putative spermidine/putrescine transport system permease protein
LVTAVLLYLVGPSLAIIPLSFSSSPTLDYPIPHLSLRWYSEFFESDQWLPAFRNSMLIASAATLLATVLGTLAALGLTLERFPLRVVVTGFLVSPLVVPIIVTAVGTYFFFAPLGLTGSYGGMILAHSALAVPMVVITVTATLSRLDRNYIRAASSLGASPIRTFWKVILPLVLPGVVTGALLAFSTSLDEVVIALFLAGPKQTTLPLQMIYGMRYELSPVITAVATMLLAVSILVLGVVMLMRRRSAASEPSGVSNKGIATGL